MADVPPPTPPPEPPPAGAPAPDIGAALSYGWQKFTENVGPMLLIVLIPIVAQLVIFGIFYLAIGGVAGQFIGNALSYIAALMLAIGLFNAGLMATSGQPVDVGKAFSSDRWGAWLGFSFVFGLMVGVGALFCGIGALVVIAFFGFAPFYFLEQNMGLGDALSASLAKTRENTSLALALAVVALVGALGVIACLVGIFVTYPLAYTAAAFLYRRSNNQPVAP